MALIRWRPFEEMEIISRQIDRMFDDMLGMNRSFAKYNNENWTPAIELRNTREDLILRSELPGVDAKNLEVQVAKQAVLISGEIKDELSAEESGYYRSELHYGQFRRMINLPVPIKNEQVKAEFKNGILKLVMPKTEDAKFKKVNIEVVEEQNKLSGTNSNKILDIPAKEA
ncbi:MAG: Hsp20/alpha crystallin family protein [Rivularia sp. (in: Bacteria)]|nr:Hsp20/alpha crystallin family protein [Rivularia sp. MS3]